MPGWLVLAQQYVLFATGREAQAATIREHRCKRGLSIRMLLARRNDIISKFEKHMYVCVYIHTYEYIRHIYTWLT